MEGTIAVKAGGEIGNEDGTIAGHVSRDYTTVHTADSEPSADNHSVSSESHLVDMKVVRISFGDVANRILFSRYYIVLYILMGLLSLFLLIWALVNHEYMGQGAREESWYIALDITVSCILLAEVFVRIVASFRTFWNSWLNRFDCLIVLVIIASLVFHFIDPDADLLGPAVLMLRYVTQSIRLFIIFKHTRDRAKIVKAGKDNYVDFRNLDDLYSDTSETETLKNGLTYGMNGGHHYGSDGQEPQMIESAYDSDGGSSSGSENFERPHETLSEVLKSDKSVN